MEMPTLTQLSTLRSLLSMRLRDLRAQVRTAERRRRDAEGTSLRDTAGTAGVGVADVVFGLGRVVDEMEEVEAALRRLDGGVYGGCLRCGSPIGLQRLMRQPSREHCEACCESAAHKSASCPKRPVYRCGGV